MRFKDYIMEEVALPKVPSSKAVSYNEAVEWVKANASKVMKRVKDGKLNLVRGVDGTKGEYQLGDSTSFKRVSKNTHNYYTKFIATSKKWEAYPSRESAYICASTDRIASGYGDIFYVIPADDAKVGKCNSHDIWKSFPVLEESIGLPGLNSLNGLLMSLMKLINRGIVPDTDAEAIRGTLRGWTMKMLYDLVEKADAGKVKISHQDVVSIEAAVRTMAKKGFSNFEELLEYCLDPSINNLTTAIAAKATVPEKPGVEAWIEGKALFIREDVFKEFLEQYK
jgi:hypothetical protein